MSQSPPAAAAARAASPGQPSAPGSATTDPLVSARVAGSYLTFRLSDEEYGVPILRVREILGVLPVTPVPGSPPAMRGVVNLRGKVIPVLCLRRRFGFPDVAADPQNVIIVVEHGSAVTGLAVDRVQEVAVFAPGETEPPPASGFAADAGCVAALGNSAGRIRILLDIDRLLSER